MIDILVVAVLINMQGFPLNKIFVYSGRVWYYTQRVWRTISPHSLAPRKPHSTRLEVGPYYKLLCSEGRRDRTKGKHFLNNSLCRKEGAMYLLLA